MKLTSKNYYGKDANVSYMSVSQFKDFRKCEAMALAKIKGEYESPQSKALLLGSFVDEMLTGTKKSKADFIVYNRAQLFQKSSKIVKFTDEDLLGLLSNPSFEVFDESNKPLAEIAQALETIERIKKQPLMMHHFKSKHQTIMTGVIAGVPFKIKMDNYKPHEFISDGKYMASSRSDEFMRNNDPSIRFSEITGGKFKFENIQVARTPVSLSDNITVIETEATFAAIGTEAGAYESLLSIIRTDAAEQNKKLELLYVDVFTRQLAYKADGNYVLLVDSDGQPITLEADTAKA